MEITNNYKNFDDDIEEQRTVETVPLLMTEINGHDFALRFENVIQIAQLEDIYPVPDFPDYVLGYARISEEVVPIIDLRKRFGFGESDADAKRCIVVSRDEHGIKMGLVVDAVRHMRQTVCSEIMPAPSLGDEYTKYISGMFKRKAGSICYIIEPGLMYTLTAKGMRLAKRYRIKRKPAADNSDSC